MSEFIYKTFHFLLFFLSVALPLFMPPFEKTGMAAEEKEAEINQPKDKIIKRTPKIEMYKCSDCHSTAKEFNPKVRELEEEHDDKRVHFGEEEEGNKWCLSCHKEKNYDRLTLKNGGEIHFNKSYTLCGECHGEIYQDWKINIHGKRIGSWSGAGEVFSCPACHDPHEPAFKPLKPEKAPTWPRGKKRQQNAEDFHG